MCASYSAGDRRMTTVYSSVDGRSGRYVQDASPSVNMLSATMLSLYRRPLKTNKTAATRTSLRLYLRVFRESSAGHPEDDSLRRERREATGGLPPCRSCRPHRRQ